MHHIPRIFTGKSRGSRQRGGDEMDPSKTRRRPKLERRNAVKNIEYDCYSNDGTFTTTPSSSSPVIRSAEFFSDKTSFRIEGIEGEFDRICQSLDLSGIDEFAIPAAEWEEGMKARSLSDFLPKSRLSELQEVDEVERESINSPPNILTILDGAKTHGGLISKEDARGIKGARPSPMLKPPPSMKLPKANHSGTTWDLMRSLAPESDDRLLDFRIFDTNASETTGGGRAEDISEMQHSGGREGLRNSALMSESSSFTTSHDDDSSSSTTDLYNISPNLRNKRVISEWEKGKLLGSGSFGSVYEGIAHDGGFFFAVKEVSLLDQGSQGKQRISQLQQEIELLSQFEHENIVQYYGTETEADGSKLYIFLELVSQGSLLSLYHNYHLRDSQVSAYTRQILHGLKYLHDRNVVHRDIKCANILVDANGSVKLADFGLAKATKLNDVRSSKGTPLWMAPEVVNRRNQGYGLQADIWSLGCTVLEMLTGQFPYAEAEGPMQALFRIGEGIPPSVPESLSADAKDFISRCLRVDPSSRPASADLLEHPFVKRPLALNSASSSPFVGRRSREFTPQPF